MIINDTLCAQKFEMSKITQTGAYTLTVLIMSINCCLN